MQSEDSLSQRTDSTEVDFGDLLATRILSSSKRVWLKVPWFSSESGPSNILDALELKSRQGLDVRIILRPEASNSATITKLARANIAHRCERYLHEKELVTDDELLSFSSNLTNAELTRNSNVSYPITNANDVAAAVQSFEAIWKLPDAVTSVGEERFIAAESVVPAQVLKLLGRSQLNPLQAKVLPVVFGSSRSLVVTAPTGAGKTDIGLAAILKAIKIEGLKAVLISPARALTRELGAELVRWNADGISTVTLTGDAEVDDASIRNADLWLATTEKFESLFRRSAFADFLSKVGVVVIDEFHFLGDPNRGAILEALVSRLRQLSARTRIVGLSATIENAEELAKWLDADFVTTSWRPISLRIQTISFESKRKRADEEAEKNRITKEIVDDVRTQGGQVIVFCGTRANARRVAAFLARVPDGNEDVVARNALQNGVGLHYRDLASTVESERRFRRREISVLVATTTLAQGVNLPARAVIIRDDILGRDTPVTVGDVMQMAGRAGRPGHESEGYAFLIVSSEKVSGWRAKLISGNEVSSQLKENLADYILAEVLLKTVTSRSDFDSWYRGTFAAWTDGKASAPSFDTVFDSLLESGMISADANGDALSCTALGALTSKFLVEVESGTRVMRFLKSRPLPRSAEEAEANLIVAVGQGVKSLSETYASEAGTKEVVNLLSSEIMKVAPKSLGHGAWKSILAMDMALRDPASLEGRNKIADYSTRDLAGLADSASRYFAWLGATGMTEATSWESPVAKDICQRIEYRLGRPPRGAGRFLTVIEQYIPPERRFQKEVVLHYRQLMKDRHARTLFYEENPNLVTLQFGVAASIVGTSVVINSIAGLRSIPRCRVLVSVRTATDSALTTIYDWAGSEIEVPLPSIDSTEKSVTVDILIFSSTDWKWFGETLQASFTVVDPIDKLRSMAQQLDKVVPSANRQRFGSSYYRRQHRLIESFLALRNSSLKEFANTASGTGSPLVQASRLLLRLQLLIRLEGPPDRIEQTPFDVLFQGSASRSEYAICACLLLRCVGFEVGVAWRAQSYAIVILKIGNQWFIEPDAKATGSITPIGGRGDEGPFVTLDLDAASASKEPPSLQWQFLHSFSSAFRDSSAVREVDGATLVEGHSSSDTEHFRRQDISIIAIEEKEARGSGKSTIKHLAPKRAGVGWTGDEDDRLKIAFNDGGGVKALALQHERSEGAITSRLRKLGLIDEI